MTLGLTRVVRWNWAVTMALAALIVSLPLTAAMSVERQNHLIQRHCSVCHTDASRNGGLTLQHFDAAKADPSLAAMLLSKLRGGAMGAAGLPFEKADANDLDAAMFVAAAGAQEWTVTRGAVTTASILREISTGNTEQPSRYRLVITCDSASQKGEVQLSWAPSPRSGTLMAGVDNALPIAYKVEGAESMGNGSAGTTGHSAVILKALPLPGRTLTISGLFPGESPVFDFERLAPAQFLFAACFVPGK